MCRLLFRFAYAYKGSGGERVIPWWKQRNCSMTRDNCIRHKCLTTCRSGVFRIDDNIHSLRRSPLQHLPLPLYTVLYSYPRLFIMTSTNSNASHWTPQSSDARMTQVLDDNDHATCSIGNQRALLSEKLDCLRLLRQEVVDTSWMFDNNPKNKSKNAFTTTMDKWNVGTKE
jgi:hypothetical protein